ncbi:hypothetical protein [Paenibacillus tyrfis]|uniref:Uncharacterized protein n=1 Tax=Paenibacillus tyrfis TaxID=1501230 RepID=A0A081P404_9BACL|nr:hypothetical protein [Paenibacillus tyrfis]KEQ25427.1 hypothetical protein ET33_01505 [Paenibacillus tyrfis]
MTKIRNHEEDVRLLKVPESGNADRKDDTLENIGMLAGCLNNQTGFVNGVVTYNGNSYTIANLAKWVAYQTYKSPFYGILPPAFILVHWAIEMGWSVSEFQSRWNPGNQRALCGFSGTSNGTPTGTSFSGPNNGVRSYAKLLIEGYPHLQYAYSDGGFDNPGLSAAASALYNGYYSNYGGSSTNYCSSQSYTLKDSNGGRPWTVSVGYEGFYNTIVNRDCIYAYRDRVFDDPGLPGMTNLY